MLGAWYCCVAAIRRVYAQHFIIGWQSTSYLGSFRSMRLAEPSSNEVASR